MITRHPQLRRSQHRRNGHQVIQQSDRSPQGQVRWRSGQPGSLPGQRTRPGTALQLAPAHHRAYQRWHNKEPAHSLRPSILGQHQGTRGHLREHTDQGRARQRYVLLLLV